MTFDSFDEDKIRNLARTAFRPLTQWEKLRHPLAGWTRVALGLALPVVVWSHNPLMIALLLVAIVIHPYWFPAYVSATEDEPLMTRLMDAFHAWLTQSSIEDRIIVFFPGLVLFVPLLAALWEHSLFWSFYLFLAIATYKAMIGYRLLTGKAPVIDEDSDIHA